MFDAYTVKKVMPRLFIAAILIQLSWPIFTLMMGTVSQIAWGIEGLLYAPFGGRDALDIGIIIGGSSGTGTLVTLLGASGAVAGGAAVALGPAGLLSLAITIILGLLVAFFVLAIRQVLLVILLVTAPLALVAWILPNTEKFWKLWWESFSKALLMYPMILLLIAGGRIAAKIASDSDAVNTGNPAFRVAIILIAFFGPFFLIPKTFQLAGSAFANIAGIANNRSRGAFDRLKNLRTQQTAQRHQDRMEGKNWLGSGRTGNAYQRVAMGGANGSWSPSKGGRARFKSAQLKALNQTSAEALKNDEGFAAGNDDATALAAQVGMTRNKFISEYQKMKGMDGSFHSKDEALAAMTQMETSFGARMGSEALSVAAFKARAASTTAYSADDAGKLLMGQEGGALVKAGLMTVSDAAGAAKANRGRSDISAAGFVDTMKYMQKGADGALTLDDAHKHTKAAFDGADPREIVAGHANSVKAFAPVIHEEIDRAVASGDKTDIANAMAKAAGLYDTLASTSPKKAGEFATQVFGKTLLSAAHNPLYTKPGGTVMTVREIMEDYRSDPIFLDRRREYSSAIAAAGSTPPPVPTTPPPSGP